MLLLSLSLSNSWKQQVQTSLLEDVERYGEKSSKALTKVVKDESSWEKVDAKVDASAEEQIITVCQKVIPGLPWKSQMIFNSVKCQRGNFPVSALIKGTLTALKGR